MVKIIYAINGEGLGHATRSEAIISELNKKHNVLIIAASSRIYAYLNTRFKNIKKFEGIRIKYKNNSVDDYNTLKDYLTWLAKDGPKYAKYIYKIFKTFKPDILITDFEGTTAYIANILNIPVLCVCNVHAVTKLKYSIPKKYLKTKSKSKLVIKTTFPKANYHLITTFFKLPVKSKNVFLFPPVLRKEFFETKTCKKDYILVYQTSDTNQQLIKILRSIEHKFIIYGFNKNEKTSNFTFRKFSDKQMLTDLSECEAVITNGGYSLVTEAISLHKPVLSIPIKGQFEQILNALYIKRLGYGNMIYDLDKNDVIKFIKNLHKYEKNLKNFKREDNSKILAKIEEIITERCSS